ncbi:calcium/sodium antiporter [Criblamydia sequanensis]|uniref:Ca2+/Na+ antiporter n=1 Tax=Candidatus Criblamydia sequanensis CRIB-18 TaxID=1437425 RepID=A0A090CY51_9BACT|nr:Ca2+/Na+ antiporter [Criblamydia sequanensis CRIB-18]
MLLILALMFMALAAMVIGAELLVLGASRLAAMVGVSPLVIGLTIVSFGTSAPEFVVSIKGALTNHSDLVVGNCIGSNIFNVLFILGACAVVAPLVVTKQLIRLDVPIMIGSNLIFLWLSIDGIIDRYEGLLLLTGFTLYNWFIIRKSLQENSSKSGMSESPSCNVKSSSTLAIIKQLGLITIGLIFCISGAELMVDNAVTLARILGVSELIIGLTIVSIGTSLPEVATSIVATIRGQRDIAIGNVVGSCIFNILGVIGLAGLIAPAGITVAPSVLRFDLPVAIAASIACLPIFFTDYKISKWEGFLFLFYYVAYITYLILDAKQHEVLPMVGIAMLFTIPLTILTLLVIVYRSIRSN